MTDTVTPAPAATTAAPAAGESPKDAGTSRRVESPKEGVVVTPTPTPNVGKRPSFDMADEEAFKIIGIKPPNYDLNKEAKVDWAVRKGDPDQVLVKTEALDGSTEQKDAKPTPEAAPEQEVPAKEENKPLKGPVVEMIAADGTKITAPLDAKVTYKVNGLNVIAPLAEVLKKVSGVDNIDRLYQDFKKKEDGFKRYVGGFIEASKTPEGALKAVIEAVALQGHDPIEFSRNLRKGVIDFALQYNDLTPEQQEALDLAEENRYLKSQKEAGQQKQAQTQQEAQHQQLVAQAEATYGMPEGEFERAAQFLQAETAAGRWNQQITYQSVGEFFKTAQAHKTVTDAISNAMPTLLENSEAYEALINLATSASFTQEEIEEAIKEAYGTGEIKTPEKPKASPDDDQAVRNLNDKVRSNGNLIPASKPEAATKVRPYKRPIEGWDSI